MYDVRALAGPSLCGAASACAPEKRQRMAICLAISDRNPRLLERASKQALQSEVVIDVATHLCGSSFVSSLN